MRTIILLLSLLASQLLSALPLKVYSFAVRSNTFHEDFTSYDMPDEIKRETSLMKITLDGGRLGAFTLPREAPSSRTKQLIRTASGEEAEVPIPTNAMYATLESQTKLKSSDDKNAKYFLYFKNNKILSKYEKFQEVDFLYLVLKFAFDNYPKESDEFISLVKTVNMVSTTLFSSRSAARTMLATDATKELLILASPSEDSSTLSVAIFAFEGNTFDDFVNHTYAILMPS